MTWRTAYLHYDTFHFNNQTRYIPSVVSDKSGLSISLTTILLSKMLRIKYGANLRDSVTRANMDELQD